MRFLLPFMNNMDNTQLLGIGATALFILVTFFVFFYANQMENLDKEAIAAAVDEETDNSSLMKPGSQESEDLLTGKTDVYEWSQGDSELEVFINLTSYPNKQDPKLKLKAKDISVSITSSTLKVAIFGVTVMDGEFYHRVLADDSCWLIDEIKSSLITPGKQGNEQVLWITLLKANVSNRGDFWPGVLKGDAQSSKSVKMAADPTSEDTRKMMETMQGILSK